MENGGIQMLIRRMAKCAFVILLITLCVSCTKKGDKDEQLVSTEFNEIAEIKNYIYQLEEKYLMLDDFESYTKDDMLPEVYMSNTNGGTMALTLEKENKVQGMNAMKVIYDYKSAGYAGIVKDSPGLNLSSFDGICLWCDMDGSKNTFTVQIMDADGVTWESIGYLDSKGGKDVYVPFESFAAPTWDTEARGAFDKSITIERIAFYTNQIEDRVKGELFIDAVRGAVFNDQLNKAKVEILTEVAEPITGFPYQITGTASGVQFITLSFGDARVNVPVIDNRWSYAITENDRVYQEKDIDLLAEITYLDGTVIAESLKQKIFFDVEGQFNIPEEVFENTNLAKPMNITVSSTESEEHKSSYVADSDNKTRWSSVYEDQQFLVVDLEKETTFNYILLQWEAAYSTQYEILGSNDSENWELLYQQNNCEGGNELIDLSESHARYIKLDMKTRATIYGNSLYEFGIYVEKPEMPVNEDAVDPVIHSQGKELLSPSLIKGEIAVMDFINQISGQYTVMGMHNREPNAEPTKQTERVWARTGVYPGLWSGDFLFSEPDIENRWKMIEECKTQWEQGAIVQLMLHVTAPNQEEIGDWEGGVKCELTDEEWTALITDGGELNKLWKSRLDTYCEYLAYLKDHEVTVLFRPFHEMNQSLFWWGGRAGENGTAALYRLTRNYIEDVKGLDNIIWVWNMQDLDYNWVAYNPGDDYWDIFSVDFYNGDGFTQKKYETALSVAGDKPIAIGECDVLPSPEKLLEQPKWVFCMSWAELTFEKNSSEAIQNLYWAKNTFVKEELPKFK